MFSPLVFGQSALGAAGTQAGFDNRLQQAQRLWPEYPDAWGPQLDAWQFGYEFDPREIGIQEAPRSISDLDILNIGGSDPVPQTGEIPLWQRAACRLSWNYEDCLIGMQAAGGVSPDVAVATGRDYAERGSLQSWLSRGVYIFIGFALLIIGLVIVGFVKPRDFARALPMARAAMPARGGATG